MVVRMPVSPASRLLHTRLLNRPILDNKAAEFRGRLTAILSPARRGRAMQGDDKRFQLRLILHAGCALDAAVYIHEPGAALPDRLANIFRIQAAGEDPEISTVGTLQPGKLRPVARLARAAETVVKSVEQDEFRDRERRRRGI